MAGDIDGYLDRYVVWVRRVFRNHLGLGHLFYLASIVLPFCLLVVGVYICAVMVMGGVVAALLWG